MPAIVCLQTLFNSENSAVPPPAGMYVGHAMSECFFLGSKAPFLSSLGKPAKLIIISIFSFHPKQEGIFLAFNITMLKLMSALLLLVTCYIMVQLMLLFNCLLFFIYFNSHV